MFDEACNAVGIYGTNAFGLGCIGDCRQDGSLSANNYAYFCRYISEKR